MKLTIPNIALKSAPQHGYVIYDTVKEKFSTGTTCPYWREGKRKHKVWNTMGALKNHLAMFVTTDYIRSKLLEGLTLHRFGISEHQPYNRDCVIYDVVADELVCTVAECYEQMLADRRAKDAKEQKKRTDAMIAEIRKMNGQEP